MCPSPTPGTCEGDLFGNRVFADVIKNLGQGWWLLPVIPMGEGAPGPVSAGPDSSGGSGEKLPSCLFSFQRLLACLMVPAADHITPTSAWSLHLLLRLPSPSHKYAGRTLDPPADPAESPLSRSSLASHLQDLCRSSGDSIWHLCSGRYSAHRRGPHLMIEKTHIEDAQKHVLSEIVSGCVEPKLGWSVQQV